MSITKEGFLKIKIHNQTKWHRRYCIIDWDKSILFIASKADTRYKDWIKLLPNIIINDYDSSSSNETTNVIEIKTDNGTTIHLLQSETKIDYESWLLTLKRTAYSRIGGGIFGQSLEDTYKYSREKISLVPLIVRQCCEHLLEYGSTFVGLFRVPGKQSSIKELRDIYDRGLSIELNNSYSPATISSLLKIYLQSLPEPIISTKYFDDFLEIGSRFKYNQINNDLDRLKQLIEIKLSTIDYAVLSYLCLFLKKLTNHVQITKMDTDNLAVVFGNNLIRPAEELDLNMIKGHNYNLLPLIKVLIDYSEYIFPETNNFINQYQDSSEQSITKSSGFSSFSSLLSTNDNSLLKNSRSLSMPLIYLTTFSSYDNENLNHENQLERKNLFTEKEINLKNNYLNNQQKSTSIDILETNQKSMDNILFEQNIKLDKQSYPIEIRKMEKYPTRKSFANKFGKSFNNIKSSMSKALQSSHTLSNENESQINNLPNTNESERKSFDIQLTKISSNKNLQNQIDRLKELLEKKDLLILELTNNSHEEHIKFEKEKFQLNQKIEQLQNENIQLHKQLNNAIDL